MNQIKSSLRALYGCYMSPIRGYNVRYILLIPSFYWWCCCRLCGRVGWKPDVRLGLPCKLQIFRPSDALKNVSLLLGAQFRFCLSSLVFGDLHRIGGPWNCPRCTVARANLVSKEDDCMTRLYSKLTALTKLCVCSICFIVSMEHFT